MLVGLKSVLSETRIATPAVCLFVCLFVLLSICLVNLLPSLYFESMCVFTREMCLLNTAKVMGLDFSSNLPVCLWLVHLACLHLRLILLCVNLILPYCYWPAVLPLSWCSFFLGLYHLVCFCSGWSWFFLSMFNASFRSSCQAGLVVTKISHHLLVCKGIYFSFAYEA